MLHSYFSQYSRPPSPSLNETIDSPVSEDHHTEFRTPSYSDITPTMGEYVPMPARGIGTVLRNVDTEQKLEFIQHLKRIGVDKYVDLPQVSDESERNFLLLPL
jgi:hypothetical protein